MSSFFNRITAFLLGIILTVTAVAGAGFFFYKKDLAENPDKDGLQDYSVEELVDLLNLAMQSPDEYTLARLEEEYGISLRDFLIDNGINLDEVDEGDWNALANVSIFNIVNGIEPFLDGIKLRSLYVILPQITGLSLDEILSKEAQVKLGDYTLWELMNSNEINKELGLVSALKGLKFGAFLPSVFDAEYNEDKHEYIYVVKDGNGLGILNIFANVSMKGVMDIVNGSDPLTEIMEGDLVTVSHLKIVDILGDFSTIGGSQLEDTLAPFLRVFGDATLGDLFAKDNGEYKLTFDKLATEVEIGYLLGFEKYDGVWYKDEDCTEKIDGILETLASLNLKEVLEADGDTVALVEAVAGDMSILTLYETFVDDEDIPFIVTVLGNVTVSDLLRNGTENIGSTLVEMLDTYIGNLTLGDALDDLLTFKQKDDINKNALTRALMDLRLGDFLKEEYTLETFLTAFENAIGEVTIGETLNYKKDENGNWICDDEVLGLLLDITFSNIFDVLRSDDAVEMTKALVGDMSIGQIYGAIFGFEKTEEDAIWHKGADHVTNGFSEFLDVEIWKLVASAQKDGEYNIYYDFEKLTLGDVAYGILLPLNVYTDKVKTDGEAVYLDGDMRRLTEPFFAITVKEFANEGDGAFKKVARELLVGDVLVPLLSDFENIEFTANYSSEQGKWIVESSKIPTIYNNLFNVKVGELYDSFTKDNFAIWEQIVGDTYLYEIVDCFTNTWQNDCFLRCLYSAKAVDFVKLLGAQKTLSEVYGHIKLIDCLGCYLPDAYLEDPVIYATFQATVDDLVFLFTNEDSKLFREGFFHHYGEFTIRDFMNSACLLGGVEGDPVEVLPVGKHLTNKLLDTKFNQFDDGVKNGLKEIAKTVYAGDFFAEVLEKVLTKLDVNHSYVINADGTYTVSGRFSVLCNKLYNKTFYELYKSMNKEGIKNIAEEFYVGDFIAEIVAKAMDIAEISHSYTIEEDGTYTVTGKFSQLLNKVYNKNGRELLEKANREGVKELLGEFLVGDFGADICVKALSMFDVTSTYEINEDGTYSVNGRFGVLLEKVYNKTLREVLSSARSKEGIKDLLGEFYVGDFAADIVDKALEVLDVYSAFEVNEDGTYTVEGKFKVLLEKVYNKTLKDLLDSMSKQGIKDLLGEFYVGDFSADIVLKAFDVVGIYHEYEVNADGTYTINGRFKVLLEKVYNKTLKDLLDSMSKQGVKDLFSEFYVGDFSADIVQKAFDVVGVYNEFTVNADGTYTVDGRFKVLLEKVYNKTLKDLLDCMSKQGIKDLLGEFYVGDFVADVAEKVFDVAGIYHEYQVNADGTYTVLGNFEILCNKAYNYTLKDLATSLSKQGIKDIMNDFLVGDFAHEFFEKAMAMFDVDYGMTYDGETYKVTGAFATFLTKVYNYSIYELTEFRHKDKIKEFINAPLGEYLVDLIPTIKEKAPKLYDGEVVLLPDGTYSATGNYYKLMTIIANIKPVDALKGFMDGGKSYLFGDEMFGSLYYGDIMDEGLNSYDETLGVWYDKNGDPIDFGSVQEKAIQSRLYSVKLSSLVTGLDVTDIIGSAYLGEMLNYECDNAHVLGHEHNDSCVWKKQTNVYVEGEGETTMLMPLDTLDRILAELSVEDVLKGKFSIKSLVEECKLGDLFNLYEYSGVWYSYKTENGLRVVDENGEYVVGQKCEELYQTVCPIVVGDIMTNNGIDVIMDSIKTLELGYVLGYELRNDNNWYDGANIVQGAMQKMCHHTMNELTGDIHNIVEEWTFGDVFDDETINSNPFFKHMKDYTIHEASAAINSMQIGEVMGYTRTGNNWYDDGVLVTDEIIVILSNYYIGSLTKATGYELYDDDNNQIGFSDHIVQEISQNVSIGTIFEDAGEPDADGFLSLVDPTWKLGELSTKLIDKVKTDSSIEDLIHLGVFGDYFLVPEGETVSTATDTNFVMMDKIFQTKKNGSAFIADADNDGIVTDAESRAYWTSISMPEFMEELMLTINEYYAKLQAYETLYGPLS